MSRNAKPLNPPKPIGGGKKEYLVHGGKFIVDDKYDIVKTVGTGAYGIVCSACDTTTNEKVAIKKIGKVFDDLVDGKRILREIKLLSFLNHENIISIKDLLRPQHRDTFEDIYFASELMVRENNKTNENAGGGGGTSTTHTTTTHRTPTSTKLSAPSRS